MTVQGDLKIVMNSEVRIVSQVVVNKNSVLLVRKILRALDLEINLCESSFNMLGANLANSIIMKRKRGFKYRIINLF